VTTRATVASCRNRRMGSNGEVLTAATITAGRREATGTAADRAATPLTGGWPIGKGARGVTRGQKLMDFVR